MNSGTNDAMRGDEGLAGNGSLDVLPRELSSIIASSLKPEEHVLWQGMGESKYHIAKRIHAYVVYIFVCIVIAALLLDLLDSFNVRDRALSEILAIMLYLFLIFCLVAGLQRIGAMLNEQTAYAITNLRAFIVSTA